MTLGILLRRVKLVGMLLLVKTVILLGIYLRSYVRLRASRLWRLRFDIGSRVVEGICYVILYRLMLSRALLLVRRSWSCLLLLLINGLRCWRLRRFLLFLTLELLVFLLVVSSSGHVNGSVRGMYVYFIWMLLRSMLRDEWC